MSWPLLQHSIVEEQIREKSSLIAVIFRLSEPWKAAFDWWILDTNIGLHDLRKKISVAPQVCISSILSSFFIKYRSLIAFNLMFFQITWKGWSSFFPNIHFLAPIFSQQTFSSDIPFCFCSFVSFGACDFNNLLR